MKVILFTDSLGAGGAQRQLVGLAILLKRELYDVKVCTYHDIDFYKKTLAENNIDNVVIHGENYLNRILLISRYFKIEKPDWVISYQESPSLIACLTKLLGCKYKLLVSERSTTQHLGLKEKIRFLLYRLSDVIVPNSYSQESFLTDNYKYMQSKIKTITNFVDLDNKFSYSLKKRSDKPKILIAASIWQPKNTLGFIEAVKMLSVRNYSFVVEWYGLVEGHEEYVDKCLVLIDKYKLHEYIKLLPKTNKIDEKYKSCDYFCLPSFYEGTPNVICEAISTGRPVICSDVCDNSIYVKEDYNGYLFDPKNPVDIADNIEKALSLAEARYDEMCVNSRKIAEELLSEDMFVKKYVELIEKY